MELLGVSVWMLFLLYVPASIMLASVRNDLVEAIGEAVNVLASWIDEAADWLLAPSERNGNPTLGIERAVVYMALFCLVGPADAVMMADRIATLLGVEETGMPLAVGLLMGLSVIFAEITYTLVYLDLAAKTTPPPWDDLPEQVISFLKNHALHLAIALALTTGGLWLWGAMAVTGTYLDGLGWLLTMALGVQLAGSAALAFAVGRSALPLLLKSVLALVGGILKMLVALLDKLAATLTKLIDVAEATGRRIWNWFVGTPLGQRLSFGTVPPREPRPLIGRASTKEALPSPSQAKVEDMKPRPQLTVIGYGKTGADIALHVTRPDVAWGVLDKDRSAIGLLSPPAFANGCVNVSPTPGTLSRGQEAALEDMFNRAGDAHVEKEASHGVTTLIVDDVNMVATTEQRQAKRFPDERLFVISSLAGHGLCRQSGSVINCHYDPDGPLMARLGYERNTAIWASVVDTMQMAAGQYEQNLAFGQIVERLGRLEACWALRNHSELCAPGKPVPIFGRLLKASKGFSPAYGDPSDIVNRACTACETALEDDAASSVAAPFAADRPFAAIFRIPLPARHPEFASVVRSLDTWLRQHHGSAQGIYASANGTAPTPTGVKERWVQCSILFTLVDSPTTDSGMPLRTSRQRRVL